tara:strand:+ start:104007 stop:104723 length:717 start_codon:yes stop_codon:yes gene_type:complete
VGKRLSDIKVEIKVKEEKFFNYFKEVLEGEMFDFLEQLSSTTKVFVFSGIIRNYFLHNYLVRDVDIVVESDDRIEEILRGVNHKKNSFGGYKIFLGGKNLDLWRMDKTWAVYRKNQQTMINLELEKIIPETAFFNFSAIIYSLNNRKFFYTKDFLRFLKNRTIDYVYEPNANPGLCVVNTFYYSDRYNLKVSERLSELIFMWHENGNKNYKELQIQHFGKQIYSDEQINIRLNQLVNL